MKNILLACLFMTLALPAAANAGVIKYHEDPVYELLNDEDHYPMEDMILLAEQGDARAQYIMGDLYTKGKGGFPKNVAKGKEFFETSAINDYPFSFIRLAALAKKQRKPVEAYQWYTLAIDRLPSGPDRKWAIDARDKLKEAAKMTPDEIKRARTDSDAWLDKKLAEKKTRDAEAAQTTETEKEPENGKN